MKREKRAQGTPDFKLAEEARRTAPDYVIYCPESLEKNDAGNQHLLVFRLDGGRLAATWTTHSYEGAGDHHIRFALSKDDGVTWEPSKIIAGPGVVDIDRQTSWGFPLLSRSGRIYVLYNRSIGPGDRDPGFDPESGRQQFGWHYSTGVMEGIYSDDDGETWSAPEQIDMPRGPLDNPDGKTPATWIVWQKPERLKDGRYFTGYTRWVSPAVRTPPHNGSIHAQESVTEFMRFENIDDHPDVKDIQITYHAWGGQALRVPYYNHPAMSCAQEPSIIALPDGRLMAVMRTMSGYCWYSLGSSDGSGWCNPRPLLAADYGRPVLHPLSPSPIYRMQDGRYILFTHNNDGRVEGQSDPEFGEVSKNRTPVYALTARYDAGAEQPLVFDEPRLFLDNRRGGPTRYNTLALYGSFTHHDHGDVFWYPDAKTFILGKRIHFQN